MYSIKYWNDYRLTWNSSDFNDIDWFTQPLQNIWLPGD